MNTSLSGAAVLSRKAAAQYLGCCLTSLDRLNIPHSKVRRRVFYRQSVLENWLAKNEQTREAGA